MHGALAGLAGGAALAVVLLALGEGSIAKAVALEQQRSGPASDAMFGRGAQQAGGVLASVLFGTAMGAIFAVAYTCLRPRLATMDEWRAAVDLAAISFLTVFLVPFLKYPANPPAVGDPATIGRRTLLWLVVLAWSVVATWAAWRAARWARQRSVPEHVRLPLVALLYAAVVAAGLTLLPGNPDVVNAPATLIWRFRLASLTGALSMWAVMGIVFGWLRLADARRQVAGAEAPPPELRSSEPLTGVVGP
jgi:hypothetical protein